MRPWRCWRRWLLALTGYHWQKAGPTLQVDFPNVAGIHRHSPVRYAGAPAGVVADMRLLTAAERESNPDPANAQADARHGSAG